jgi:hypothetical protein
VTCASICAQSLSPLVATGMVSAENSESPLVTGDRTETSDTIPFYMSISEIPPGSCRNPRDSPHPQSPMPGFPETSDAGILELRNIREGGGIQRIRGHQQSKYTRFLSI